MEETLPDAVELNNNKTSHSASASDSDSESDDEAQTALELQTLATEVSSNPANYDAHVQYITALRKQGDLDKLRLAREAMSELFPLAPDMWRRWADDEISLVSSSAHEDAILTIEKLYERAVSDYMSVSLWCDYLNFIQKYDSSVREFSPTGISKVRDLYERALIACGLHFAEGSKLWETYRSFEEAVLNSIDETDSELREKQVQRIRSIFHRQLSIPHADMKSTLLTYKAWESEHGNDTFDVNSSNTDGILPHVASAYQKALDMLSVRAFFEDKIVQTDVPVTERLQSFMAYLKFEQSSGDPARVKSLYERAITEFPISGDLWIDYTNYLNKTLKADKTLRGIFTRATRNCSWVAELWVRLMLYLERSGASEQDLSDVFERSLQCTFSTIDEYAELFLTRVDGLRRRIMFAKELDDVLDFSLIRDTFQRACDHLSPQMKNTSSLLQIYSYWARLEFNLKKDMTVARGVWESLLKNSGSTLEAWQGYISMETEMGHINEARSLYKRCYSKRFPGTGSEDICNSWIRFEREFGTLEDFDHALQKVSPRLQELQFFRLQQETRNIVSSVEHKDESAKKNKGEKRKASSDAPPNQESPAKRQKAKEAPKKDSVKSNKVENTVTPTNPVSVGEDDVKTKDPTPEKVKQYTDQCTAFISNLKLSANSEDIRGFFSDVGGVGAIRILLDKNTKKSRGLAYVDFCDDTHLEAAVAKSKQMLLGKKVSIARSDPKGKGKRPAAAGQKPSTTERQGEVEEFKFKGRNMFALPRALGVSKQSSSTSSAGAEDEKPKSNEEIRKLLLKKT